MLQVVGGRYIQGRYGAVIEKVKQGSVADLAGRLLPGDEVNAAAALHWRVAVQPSRRWEGLTSVQVLEWNGRPLQSRSYEEVRDIIAASRGERAVELVVRAAAALLQLLLTAMLQVGRDLQESGRPRSPPRGSRLQVKTWYDRSRLELIVTVLSAVDLPPRTGGQYRNPYAKLFLLPDRRSAVQTNQPQPTNQN